MKKISNAPENIFRLLVPATDLTSPDIPFVELCGSRWVLTELMPIPMVETADLSTYEN